MNIVLIGMRGSGKTSVGKSFAKILKKQLIETDSLVELAENKTAGEIIRTYGISKFRKFENNVIKKLSNINNAIISTGGGVVENKSTMNMLKKKGILIYLKADPSALYKRIGDNSNRPLLTKANNMLDDLKNLYIKRSLLYEKYADLVINTDKYDLRYIEPNTELCCVIGSPIEHTLSPVMHNDSYRKLGLNYLYFAIKVNSLRKAIHFLKNIKVKGIAVTVPFKTEIIKFCDIIDDAVRKIGAANTIVLKGGMLHAFNTDAIGAIYALKQAISLKDKKAIIRGAGGASRAIAYGLKNEKAHVKILNRTISQAKKLVKELNLDGIIYEKNTKDLQNADILINASSLGMKNTDSLPFPEKILSGRQLIFDVVYNPQATKLVKLAMIRKSQIIHGDKMLLYQAVEQFKIFTGIKAPVKVMEKNLLKYLN